MRRRLLRAHALPAGVDARLFQVLGAVALFSLGASAWTAVVAGRIAQGGAGSAAVGAVFAAAEVARLPAILLLPIVTLRCGARRVTQVGLLALAALPLLALGGLDTSVTSLTLVLSAVPSMATYVGLPAFVIGAAGPGRDGRALAWLGLAGGAGGSLGPWLGGALADAYGPLPVLLLFGASSTAVLLMVTRGPLPPPTPWTGWAVLAGRGIPWLALAALGLASAADAGRAALVPAEMVRRGLSLADVGLLLGTGGAVAGAGFLVFGRMADRHPPVRIIGAGLLVLAAGSLAALLAGDRDGSLPYAVGAAILGMGASGIRLGAEVALIGWTGRGHAAVAAALGETTILSGRAVGAPAVGALGDAGGGASALGAIALAGLLTAALIPLLPRLRTSRLLAPCLVASRLLVLRARRLPWPRTALRAATTSL